MFSPEFESLLDIWYMQDPLLKMLHNIKIDSNNSHKENIYTNKKKPITQRKTMISTINDMTRKHIGYFFFTFLGGGRAAGKIYIQCFCNRKRFLTSDNKNTYITLLSILGQSLCSYCLQTLSLKVIKTYARQKRNIRRA